MASRSPQGSTYNQLTRSDALGGVTGRSLNNSNGNNLKTGVARGGKLLPSRGVEMTIVNGVLVPKNSTNDNNSSIEITSNSGNASGTSTTIPDGI